MTAETATEYGDTTVWNKLYKRSLFREIVIPEEKAYEDIAITHKLVFAANKTIMLSDRLYYYINRKDSISQTHNEAYKRDGFVAALQRYNDLVSYGYQSEKHAFLVYSYAIALLVRAKTKEDPVFKQAAKLCDSVKKIPHKLPLKKKIMLIIWKIDRNSFYSICKQAH